MPLGMNAVLDALKAVYPTITANGCKSSFRDWAGDKTSFPREVAEMALRWPMQSATMSLSTPDRTRETTS